MSSFTAPISLARRHAKGENANDPPHASDVDNNDTVAVWRRRLA